MTTTRLDAVGFCAHYSQQGDWAFGFALELARRNALQLNVFHFLEDPYVPTYACQDMPQDERNRVIIELEKRMRLYYDPKLGDYLDVGFRLCEDKEWTELHKCLMKREFQILVLGCPSRDATFGGKAIEEFAGAFVCPVVLVGPDSAHEYRLNRPAALLADKLGMSGAPAVGGDAPGFEIVDSVGPAALSSQMGL